MSTKKVNTHVSIEVRDAIRELAKNSGMSITGFIEKQKELIGDKDAISSLISTTASNSISKSAGKHTVKVFDNTRSFIKELSEEYNVSMGVIIAVMVYKTTKDKSLGDYIKNDVKKTDKRKEKKEKDEKKESVKKSKSVNFKETFSNKYNPEARENARERGKIYQNISNMSAVDIRSLAKDGDKRAKEIIAKSDQLLATENSYKRKKEAQRKREEEHKQNKKKNETIVKLLKEEAEKSRKEKEKNSNIKTVVREVLVKDVDFHEEKDVLNDIRDKLDDLIGKVDMIKPNSMNSMNTSYQLVNEIKRGISIIFVMLNQYCSVRTRLYLKEGKEI